LLLPAVLLLFGPALLHPSYILYPTFSPFSDLMIIHWPKAHLMAESWAGGEGLPHWTPLILSGMPLAANQLAMLAYPPAWLFLFLPLEPVFNLLFIGHLLLGGFGMYWLLRRAHGLSPGGALLGGLTFALSGKLLAHAAGGHVSMVGAIAWMPWTLGAMLLLLRPSLPTPLPGGEGLGATPLSLWERVSNSLLLTPYFLLLILSLAMQIVTHTLPVLYTAYLLAGVVAWHFGSEWQREHAAPLRLLRRLWLPFLATPILAGMLGAGQLLPLLELAPYSNRALSYEQAAEYSLTPAQLAVGLLLPATGEGHETIIYLGLVPLLLAPLGLAGKNRWRWFYGGVFIFALLFALGPYTPLHRLFYELAPGFRWVRTPARIFFVGAIALAALVGFGVDYLAEAPWTPPTKKWLTRLVVAVGPAALLMGLGLAFSFGLGRPAFALAIFLPAGLVLVLLRAQRLTSASLTTALLGLALFGDLAWFDLSLMRFVSPEEALAPGRAVAAYLAGQPGHFRVYSPSYSLPMQTAAAYGLVLADGVEPVHLSVYDAYMARAGGYGEADFSVTIPHFDGPLDTALRNTKPNLKLLGLLNVEYLAAAFPMPWEGLTPVAEVEGTYIYRNSYNLPRARVLHRTVPAEADWLAQLERLPDLAHVALVEADAPQLSGSRPATPATITHYSADRIEIETKIEAAGWLVLSEIWYPGWQVEVNGQAQPSAKVNGLLRGVYLPQPGQYHITLKYCPASVWTFFIAPQTPHTRPCSPPGAGLP
jgi:hypothetical protein